MEPWHTAHLVAIAFWGGFVAAEVVVELASRTDDELRHAAVLHYWMDLLVELPALVAVLVTGAVLTKSTWPPSPLLWIKIAAGLTAVTVNLWCVLHVVGRYRKLDDVASLHRHGRWVRVAATVGVPFGAVALYLGLSHFAR